MTIGSGVQRVALSAGAGLALALAFPNYNLAILAWVSVAGLIAACLGAGLGGAALYGLIYAATFLSFSVSWIYTVLHGYGSLPGWQAAGVTALMILAVSPYFVAFAMAVAWIARRSVHAAILASPFLWVAGELARSRMPDIAYPWNLLGYAASGNLALVQLTAFTGIYGLSFLVAAYNAVLLWFLRSLRHKTRSAAAICLASFTLVLLVAAIWGGRFVPVAQPSAVAHLVQPDFPQADSFSSNWEALHAGDVQQIGDSSIAAARKQSGLVVWPEVPAPFSMQQAAFAQRVAGIARDAQTYFLFGEVEFRRSREGRMEAYNSAALLDPQGREEFLYDKIHLVPFSEYVPWRNYLGFAKSLLFLASEFHSGTQYRVGQLPGGRFGVFICYESIFPDEVRQFTLGGAGVLINISDDGWFGRSAAPTTNLAITRVRAVENRRWLLRDTNNGLTASVDPYGRIMATMAPDTRGIVEAPYGFRDDLTTYTRWGDWVAQLSTVIGIGLLIWASLPGRRPAMAPSRARRNRKGQA